jgi:hypothetical protein
VELTFSNLAVGGDAISDDGKPLVSSQDALDLARRTSRGGAISESDIAGTPAPSPFSITLLRDTEKYCNIPSRRNDVLEIRYQARLGGPDGIVYDSSATRGTGQPYQMVMGSGDMLPGVDQGLYDMCPGQVRGLQIPHLSYVQRQQYPRRQIRRYTGRWNSSRSMAFDKAIQGRVTKWRDESHIETRRRKRARKRSWLQPPMSAYLFMRVLGRVFDREKFVTKITI